MDAEERRISDSFQDVDQRLLQMQSNQSKLIKQLEQMTDRLDKIAQDLSLVNGSAEELRTHIIDAVNNELPQHFAHLNGSVHELHSKVRHHRYGDYKRDSSL